MENNILDTYGKTGKPVSEVSNFVIVRKKIHIKNGTYYFDEMYLGIKDLISSAGIAYINQEGPVAGDSLGVSGYPAFIGEWRNLTGLSCFQPFAGRGLCEIPQGV